MGRPRKNKDPIKKLEEKTELEKKIDANSSIGTAKTKKSLAKSHVEKHELYVEISPDKQFALCDGRLIKDPKELAEILKTMNDDIFNFHVNDSKNDFANWIGDIFDEKDFAEEIKNIRNRIEMEARLFEHMFKKLENKHK